MTKMKTVNEIGYGDDKCADEDQDHDIDGDNGNDEDGEDGENGKIIIIVCVLIKCLLGVVKCE